MKKFLYKTLTFITISISLICVSFIFTNFLINKNAKFKLGKVNNVIFGHSHSECAFNDSLINNFKNLSQSRQSYFYSYQKIKKVLLQNNDIENVFIEFTNNQINEVMNEWIWDDLSISSRSIYLPFLDKTDVNLLLNKNSKSFITGSSKSFRNNLINLLLFDYNYTDKMGGYHWLNRFKTDSLITTLVKDTLVFHEKKHPLSNKNIEYLEKIVTFCKDKNVNIYFVRSPQHIYTNARKNEKIFIKIKNEKFKNIILLDFNDFPLDNNEFGDFEHLNYRGAKKFSLWFDELLKNGLLSKNNKNKFIFNEMNKVRTHNNAYK
ncbi:hypothetical protein [uncultured Algibacter sp.]|uniref:hypothetical protein n=1 Tax=uncultured Algibacter sp. TaxID=298659 RepID=UPI0032176D79